MDSGVDGTSAAVLVASPQAGGGSHLDQHFKRVHERSAKEETAALLGSLIQPDQYVGDVYSLSYSSALILIHDFYRKKVGGIPSLSFLVATRILPGSEIDHREEDSSLILLRVMDAAALPNDAEAARIRVETAQNVSGKSDSHWDSAHAMDATTNYLLGFAGVKCRTIGTFFVDQADPAQPDSLVLRFGSDISNYYPNRGLKVFKPNGDALRRIVNYRDLLRADLRSSSEVTVGEVRYASTNRSFQGVSNVPVNLLPADLLSQKTALFGMTRTGKSNTTKVILQSVHALRDEPEADQRVTVGQIVFDPNGEYANENTQDASGADRNPAAIKNIGARPANDAKGNIFTFGITPHPQDPGRQLMLLNFYELDNLQIGKEIIDGVLPDTSQYLRNFKQVIFERPTDPGGPKTRFDRLVLAYRALLNKAGFRVPSRLLPDTTKLFGQLLLDSLDPNRLLKTGQAPNMSIAPDRKLAARVFATPQPTWDQLSQAFTTLADWMTDKEYTAFEAQYIQKSSSGENWADPNLDKVLAMFRNAGGARQMGKASPFHTDQTQNDYADEIYQHLRAGHLVIVDQSSGDPEVNKASADRIMWKIFRSNQAVFREGGLPPDILVYVEEAHNLLPSGSETKTDDVWVRTAKEGAKYHVGMVYATQEVSSIQKNILKNTANWFIGHLNNTDETKELCKYYDFEDFEESIRRAQDRGFIRVKTLSNLFVVPIQVAKFEVSPRQRVEEVAAAETVPVKAADRPSTPTAEKLSLPF